MSIKMNSLVLRTGCLVGALAAMVLSIRSASPPAATAQMVTAANTFLSTLDGKQKQTVLFAWDDAAQRKRWSNLPIAMVPRGGISLKDMNSAQRSAAMALVASALSPRGYEKVEEIMEGDELNKRTDTGPPPFRNGGPPRSGNRPPPPQSSNGAPPPFPGGGGGPMSGGAMFGKDLYFISILGTPSNTQPWMLQFGGHHLALNITIAGERGILTPTLTGAQPALYTVNGKTVRPLGQESDKALACSTPLTMTSASRPS